jgi:hypothetical protein
MTGSARKAAFVPRSPLYPKQEQAFAVWLADLQKFWAKKTLVKSLLISTLDKVIYNNGTFLLGSNKPLITTQNRVEIN